MSFKEGFMSSFFDENRSRSMSLPPEIEEGHVEYKLKLIDPTPERYLKLVTQLKWRLAEGSCMALYEVGVEDDGRLTGLVEQDMVRSLATLQRMAQDLDADITIIRQLVVDDDKQVCEVLIRRNPSAHRFSELKVAVIGGADTGKSTLLGVLTRGGLDNGRGKSRLTLFTHRHEIETGRTSSICYEIMGFDPDGKVLNYSTPNCGTWEQICENASRVVTFIDLAGHEKYLKTTVSGLTGHAPDLACLVVSAVTGVTPMTREHFNLASAVGLPIVVVLTKIDRASDAQKQTSLNGLKELLSNGGTPLVVQREADCDGLDEFALRCVRPIFVVSNVSGLNLKLFVRFLRQVPRPLKRLRRSLQNGGSLEFQVEDIYNVPDAGTVVGGSIQVGTIVEGDTLLLGPSPEGTFTRVVIASIKRNRMSVARIEAGQTASLALKDVPFTAVRRGMVLLDLDASQSACVELEANITVLNHASTVKVNQQGMLHLGAVRQAAAITQCDCPEIAPGESGVVVFRLSKWPEYVSVGDRLLFRMSDLAKASGEVTRVIAYTAPPASPLLSAIVTRSPVIKPLVPTAAVASLAEDAAIQR